MQMTTYTKNAKTILPFISECGVASPRWHPTGSRASMERSRLIEQYLPLARGRCTALRATRCRARRPDTGGVLSRSSVRSTGATRVAAELLPAYVSRSVEGELRRHLRDRAAAVRGAQGCALRRRTPERRTAEAPISLGDEDWGTDAEPARGRDASSVR